MRTGTRGRRKLLLGWGLGVVALTAAACGSSHSTSSNPPATTAAASGSGTQVSVGETEFKLAVSMSSFNPGAYTFRAVNNGKVVHSLQITGPGVNATTPDLQPGQSADLNVTLQNGSYDLFCPIDSHKSLGMNQEITVGGSGAASGAPASAAPTSSVPANTVPASTVPASGGSGGVSY
jgi:plastocyanin